MPPSTPNSRSSPRVPRDREAATGSVAPPSPPPGAWDRWAGIATLVVAIAWIASLVLQALGARLQTDECFHAYMSEWIASHGTLPRTIPGLYSGFAYYYPPLYHILGGVAHAIAGVSGFKLVNLVVTALLVLVLFMLPRHLGVPSAGRWAVCLCAANAWLSLHAVRMYVEQLTTLLAVSAILLVLAVRRSARVRDSLALGVVTGLALTAKHSSLVIVALVALLAAFYAVRREAAVARAFGLALAVALAVAAPMLVRNQLYYGSPIYPALGRDIDPLLYRLNVAKFSPAPLEFYRQMAADTGVLVGACVLAAFVVSVVRRRWRLEVGLLGFCVLLTAAAPLQPLLDPRHMLPVIVSMAVLASLIVGEAAAAHRREFWAIRAIDPLMLATAVWFVATAQNYRSILDAPLEMDAVNAAVREHVPEGETVLSLSTYDTFYYARRPATWPIPWGQQEHPVEMFLTSDCDSVLAALHRHRLRYLLVPRAAQGETFDGANYPLPFIQCMATLLEQRRISVLWNSGAAAVLRVEE